MRTSPHEPPQVPLTEQERRDQALIAKAHMEAGQAWQATINKAMGEIELRKWCIQQAVASCANYDHVFTTDNKVIVSELAKEILLFVGASFTDLI